MDYYWRINFISLRINICSASAASVVQSKCTKHVCMLAKHSLQAGSPLSHAREQRRAKRSGGKESGEEVTRKWVTYSSRRSISRSRLRRVRLYSKVSLLAAWASQCFMTRKSKKGHIIWLGYRLIKDTIGTRRLAFLSPILTCDASIRTISISIR